MEKKTLDHLALPKTTPREAVQALESSRRRALQMLPGHGPVPPEGDEAVSHYVGPEEDAHLGAPPEDLLKDDPARPVITDSKPDPLEKPGTGRRGRR